MKPQTQSLCSGLLLLGVVTASASVWAQPQYPDGTSGATSQQSMQQQKGNGQGGGNGMNMNMNKGNGANGGMKEGEMKEGGMMAAGMMEGGMMMEHMQQMHANLHAGDSSSGQSAFDLIKQVVDQLQANPNTDWEQVNIEALRQHLVDMNQVTLYAEVESSEVDGGARFVVTGDGRTRDAIKRMLPTHATQIQGELGWNTEADEIRNGVTLIVTSDSPAEAAKIRGLGFMGFMVQGEHHADHHLLMAGGQAQDHSGMNHGSGEAMEHDQSGQATDHSGH